MNSHNDPLSFRNILAGILITVVGGVILAAYIQDGERFSHNEQQQSQDTTSSVPEGSVENSSGGIKIAEQFPSVEISPQDFMREQYQILNDRKYDEAWSRITDNFKNVCPQISKRDYIEFWNSKDRVDVVDMGILGMPSGKPVVEVVLRFHTDGRVSEETLAFQLIKSQDGGSWLIEAGRNSTKDCIVW
jgi:hypothetical protein